MTRQPESKIVNAILDALNALPQTFARKTHGSRYSVGWPDIVGCHRGRMFAIEAKQPGKDATPRQRHELAKWRQAGALVGVVHDVDEALSAIEYEPVLTRDQCMQMMAESSPRLAERVIGYRRGGAI